MMRLIAYALVLAAAVASVLSLPSATGNRVLVVIDTASKSQYSTFFTLLTSRGYSVTYKAPRDGKPELSQFDVLSFDHLVLLSPASKSLSTDLSPQSLVEFLKKGGNLLAAVDSSASEMYRDLAREFSLEFEDRGTALVDHFNVVPALDAGNHTAVAVGGRIPSKSSSLSAISPVLPRGGLVDNQHVFSEATLQKAKSAPLLYRGSVHRVGANPLAFPLVIPPATSYSSEPPLLVSEQDSVVESTSYSTPDPVTITTTKIVDGESSVFETLSTPRPVPTVVKQKRASKLGKDGWVAKGSAGSLEALETKTDLVTGANPAESGIVSLVSAFQLASNSARAVFLGSTDMISDAFMSPAKSSGVDSVNSAVLSDLTQWTFQEKGVLKVVATHHNRVRSSPTDVREDYEENDDGNKMYRIKDHVRFEVELVAHEPGKGWIPAAASKSGENLDLQVEFRMLDPYITSHLTLDDSVNATTRADPLVDPAASETQAVSKYSTTFQIPDRHGVFHFNLNFKRHGLTFLTSKDTAPVRPFNHDEHPRFLSSSWPYMAGAFSTSAAFILFVAIWLTIKDDTPAAPNAKKNI
ncbi:Dolichyl-diphosphooligosaccharide-protein glycosyltransferase 48kDa subunit [Testicularia cyperi]|uniref:Dolichyl-diphosphooligosaccharide--protein glycosyltransferase subunit WBP1 n=1 Tax=Testicularia cyperi TaxID=1882483 RepID=A0A317XKV5_9BASI|nr:Dolichyl-diphosphooligosaccharide-protein glycosyltransferase 48kDa subunit [Testicularia cyperi]